MLLYDIVTGRWTISAVHHPPTHSTRLSGNLRPFYLLKSPNPSSFNCPLPSDLHAF
jgi:hypothetical protein